MLGIAVLSIGSHVSGPLGWGVDESEGEDGMGQEGRTQRGGDKTVTWMKLPGAPDTCSGDTTPVPRS